MLNECNPSIERRKSGKVVSGAASATAKSSMSLRFFSSGDKFDIGLVHGVHTNEPHRDVWEIVDLVNNCEELKIKFPSPEEQKNTAEFQKKMHSKLW